MELFTLDNTFQPNRLIENYQSLIWTERYSENGDFELISNDVQATINALPKWTPETPSYVSIRESTVPMIVEDHKIQKKPKAAPVIVVTGRAFETVLERRASVKDQVLTGAARTAWMIAASKESDAAYRAMRTVLGDVPQYKAGIQVLPSLNPAVSPLDAIPEVRLTIPADYDTSAWDATLSYSPGDIVGSGTVIYQATALAGNLNKPPASSPTFWMSLYTGLPGSWGVGKLNEIKPGNLYTTVMDLINTNRRGLKAVRPIPGDSQVSLEVYNGADLTDTVVFDARFDQFDDTTYLLSERGSMNVGYVFGGSGSSLVLKTTAPEPSGLARRVLLVDESNEASINTADIRRSRGLIELYKYNATALFEGQIAEQVAAGYNTDYHLGDIIKLTGEYGLSQDVRVKEFIRTSDATGQKAFPAFEAVS